MKTRVTRVFSFVRVRHATSSSAALRRALIPCSFSASSKVSRPPPVSSATTVAAMDAEPDEKQARELQSFMEMENQKAVIQAAIGKLTETCFDKCVTKPGNKLDSSEANCGERHKLQQRSGSHCTQDCFSACVSRMTLALNKYSCQLRRALSRQQRLRRQPDDGEAAAAAVSRGRGRSV